MGGALYFNSTVDEMRVYTGSNWVAAYVSGGDFATEQYVDGRVSDLYRFSLVPNYIGNFPLGSSRRHQATTLTDDTVFITAGDSHPTKAYIYNCIQNYFVAISDLPVAINQNRYFIQALSDNLVYLAFEHTVYIYNNNLDTYTRMNDYPGGNHGGVRAALLADGRMYISRAANPWTTHIYDPATDSYETVSNSVIKSGPAAAPILNGKVYICSGLIGGGGYTNVAQIYDPVSDSYTTVQPIPYSNELLSGVMIAPLTENHIYICGGSLFGIGVVDEAFVYDANKDSYTRVSNLLLPASEIGITALKNGRILLVGSPDPYGSDRQVHLI